MADTKSLVKRIIIPKMRHLNYKRYVKFENELGNLSQEAIHQFNRFLQDLEYKISQLEKKARGFGF